MKAWRRFLALSVLGISYATMPAHADVYLACSFETLPDLVTHYPDTTEPATMRVGGRPAIAMTVGSGSNRFESADVDGFHFRFAPSNSVLDVEKDGKLVVSERGDCVLINGPESDQPLEISAPEPAAQTATQPALENANPLADKGDWSVSESASNFDDTATVVLRLQARRQISNRYGKVGFPTLILRCQENTTSLYIVMAGEFLSDLQGFGNVEYRIDDRPAASRKFVSSTDNQALGLWSGRASIPFAKALFDASTLRVRITPFNQSPVETAFQIAGLKAAIVPLREACSW